MERATIIHVLWDCQIVSEFIGIVFNFLNTECDIKINQDNSFRDFLFGFMGNKRGLNHVLLELKIFIFYQIHSTIIPNLELLKERFFQKVRNTIKLEKKIAIGLSRWDDFEEKWEKFLSFYDFRGPDMFRV